MLQGKIGNGVTGTGGTSAGDNGIGLHGTPCPDADACKKQELTLEHQTRTCGSPHPSEHPASLAASHIPQSIPHPLQHPSSLVASRIPRSFPHPSEHPTSLTASRIPRSIPHPSQHPASLTASLAQPNHLVLSLQRQGGFG